MWQVKISPKPIDYDEALRYMIHRRDEIINNSNVPSLLWILEHPEVYTAGSATQDNDLSLKGDIVIHRTDRGGKCTYHGPGQKIIYTIFNLNQMQAEPDIRLFVRQLELIIINMLIEVGIKAYSGEADKIGIWVNQEKICSIGLKVKKWVTHHGIALNINPDLNKFKKIVPCGIEDCIVTSLQKLGVNFPAINVNHLILKQFVKYYGPYINAES